MSISSNDELSLETAFMVPISAVIIADGEYSPAEAEMIKSMLKDCPLFNGQSLDYLAECINSSIEYIKALGMLKAIKLASFSLTMPYRETALAWSFEMGISDGVLGNDEADVIVEIQDIFEVSDEIFFAFLKSLKARHLTNSHLNGE